LDYKKLQKIYGFFYDNFLNGIPEGLAVPLGRGLLRMLPVGGLPVFESEVGDGDDDLGTELGGCRLPNPVILAACYHQPWIIRKLSGMGFGAVTLKVTREPKRGNPRPNIVRRGEGFVNCLGFGNPGMERTRRFLKGYGSYGRKKPLILNVTGDSIGEYCEVIGGLQDYADMIELNISCPNTETGTYFSANPGLAGELFREAAAVSRKPLIVKLSRAREHQEANHRETIPRAVDAGIRVVNYANTLPVCEERLSAGRGGLSGPELYEDTLRSVKRISEGFGEDLQVIATGGMDSGEKARELMEAGAGAVSYVSGLITRGPFLAREIKDHLTR
jgi:dihydroorotate dehydrogenase (NAD+) catalytic subunit